MNRILFERDEIKDGVAMFGGDRAEHVLRVLHGEVGQVLKTGEIDGSIGTSEILSIEQSEQSNNSKITVRCSHAEESRRPWVDLILAPPRPRVMKRLLPQLATLGVGRIVLVGAKKVEKDFWGATLLKEENYRPLLVDGLTQAGTSILPTLEMRRNFRKFVIEELDALFPTSVRIVAHPYGSGDGSPLTRISANQANCRESFAEIGSIREDSCCEIVRKVPILAIGPEGGWTDEEVTLLEEHGFTRYSLGARILRTDTATIALLSQLMQVYDQGLP